MRAFRDFFPYLEFSPWKLGTDQLEKWFSMLG